jgi:hypothetical protein
MHNTIRYDPGVIAVQANSRISEYDRTPKHKYKSSILKTRSLNSSFIKLAKRGNDFQINTLPQMDYGRRMVNAWGKIGNVVEDEEPGVSKIINVMSGN